MMKLMKLSSLAVLGLLVFASAQGAPVRQSTPAQQGAAGSQSAASPDQRSAELDCVIQPSEMIEISAGVLTGIMWDIYVERGDFVEEGQVLARLDSRMEEATLQMAQARVDNVAALEASLATREYFANARDRAARLYDEEILSIELKEQAEEEALLAENRYQVELEAHLLAELDLGRAKVAVEMRKLVSPVTGLVTERLVAPREFVGNTTVFSVAKLDPLFVEVVAPASLFGSVHVGTMGTVLPGEPVGGSYQAEVIIVDKVLDAASNTFGIRLELTNPDYGLPGGLRGRVRLPLGPPPDPGR